MHINTSAMAVPMSRTIATPPPDIDSIAARIRAVYIHNWRMRESELLRRNSQYGARTMARWDGGVDKWGKKHKAVWPKIASMLIARKCDDVERFIAAQFVDYDFPKPNTLQSHIAWERYLDASSDMDNTLKKLLAAQSQAFKYAVFRTGEWYPSEDVKSIWSRVILDSTAMISPLFRYCIAVSEQLEDAAIVLYHAALNQFLLDPSGYRRCWTKILPDIFKNVTELPVVEAL